MVRADEAPQLNAIDEQGPVVADSERAWVIVTGDEAAQRYARERIHVQQRRVEHGSADVVEIDVDPLRALVREPCIEASSLVVHARIEAELVHDVIALGASSRD